MKSKRGYSQIKSPIKSNMTTKYRPKRRDYLEIFILEKHKSRMIQERSNLGCRVNQIDQDIEKINKSIEQLRQEIDHEVGHALPMERGVQAPKNLKKMTVTY
jgi:CII-binding regulator of phage lambda lysogenization HflD